MMSSFNDYHVQQQDQADCGVACLKSIISYFGGNTSFEQLRKLSGTSSQGTTLLGLYQGAEKFGFDAEGYKTDNEKLKTIQFPCILHVIIDERLTHFVVCYGYEECKEKFIISDPAQRKISYLSEEDLNRIWLSKSLLILQPTKNFEKTKPSKLTKYDWIKTLIKEDANILSIALVLGLFLAMLGLSTAIFSQKLIDNILPADDLFKIMAGLSFLAFLLLIKSFIDYLRGRLLIIQSRDFNLRIVDLFYSSLLRLPKTFFDSRNTGDLIARLNDTSRIQSTVSNLASNMLVIILMIVVSSIGLFMYNWILGLSALTWIPIVAVIVYVFHPKILEKQRTVMKDYSYNESNYVDTIQGIEQIKVFNKQDYFSKITSKIYGSLQKSIYSLGKLGIYYNLIIGITATVFTIGILTYSSVLVHQDIISVGSVIAILQLVTMLMSSVNELASANIQLQEARVAFDRMHEFASIDPEFDNARKLESDLKIESIEIVNVSFRFIGRQALLDKISFDLKKGQALALLGESGSGKSTILQILERFYDSEAGVIKVNGQAWDEIDTKSWREKVSLVSQEVKIFNGTLIENICFDNADLEAKSVIKFCKNKGFSKYFEAFPQGYNTIIGEQGINLSGGQKKLLGLARALYQHPDLLLLDELTAGMDSDTAKFALSLVEKIKEDKLVIFVTHTLDLARQMNKAYKLEQGVLSEVYLSKENNYQAI